MSSHWTIFSSKADLTFVVSFAKWGVLFLLLLCPCPAETYGVCIPSLHSDVLETVLWECLMLALLQMTWCASTDVRWEFHSYDKNHYKAWPAYQETSADLCNSVCSSYINQSCPGSGKIKQLQTITFKKKNKNQKTLPKCNWRNSALFPCKKTHSIHIRDLSEFPFLRLTFL